MSVPSQFLTGLNPEQKEAVVHPGGPLLVLAGAGTGKTRVITHRIARLVEQSTAPGRILAVTFTNKAAQEMAKRVEGLVPGQGRAVWLHTFHALSARLVRQHAGLLKLTPHFTIYDSDDQKKLVVESLKELGLEEQKNKASLFVSLISRAKDDLLDAGSYSIHTMTSGDAFRETVAKVYQRYEAKLRQSGALDFGDLLMKAVELLRDHPTVTQYYQEYFLHLLVDEYQDTNHAQYILTKTLSAHHKNVCVVGDPNQSIYEWRGASIRNIMEFERDFAGAKVVKLEKNYRSSASILAAANKVIVHNKTSRAMKLWTEKPDGDPVAVHESGDENEEARWVSRRVQQFLDEGESLNETAVFYRTNAQSRAFEEALRRAQLPYRVVGAVRFYERKEIKDALAYARVLLNPADSVSLNRILNVPARGIGKTSQEALERFAAANGLTLTAALRRPDLLATVSGPARRGLQELGQLLETLGGKLATLGASAMMADILHTSGYLESVEEEAESDTDAAARLDNLQELINAMKDYESRVEGEGQSPTLQGYLESVALQSDADGYDPDAPAVTLMTVHLAKGLEFDCVFLTGLEEGLFPIGAGNSSPEDLEEERRLAYVGMTRARKHLVLSYASTRRMFGQSYSNLPSRFILEAGLNANVPSRSNYRVSSFDDAAPPPPRAGLRIGARVRHPDFGEGQVLDKSGAGETLKVTVRFQSGTVKKLLLRYAQLETL